MKDIDWGKEGSRAGVASVVALFVGLLLKALGAGKWVVAGGAGAIGGMVAVAAVA
jgi:hypothetical protein